jgi:phospholipid/cholesterol/gamma-HCH transport system substrate-binding protein
LTAARGTALGALVVAIVVVAFVLLSGNGGHTYKLDFQNAGQLVKDDDVQVGGRRIGSVRKIALTDNNVAQITVKVDEPYAPLHLGTTATIRATSLSGVANRYIALTPGPQNNSKLADGAILTEESTTSPVDLDQLFNTLTPATRKGLQDVIKGSATQYAGRGLQDNQAAHYFNPLLSRSSRLVNEVTRDQQSFENLIVYGAKVSTTLAAKRNTLTDLVTNTNVTASAIAQQNEALSQTLALLPETLRKGNTTFVNLRATLADLTVLVDASKPATKHLAKFFRELRPLIAEADPTIHDLRQLVTTPGAHNDLIDLLNQTPQLEKLAKPTFADSIVALRKTTPVVSFIRPYSPDFVGWLRDFGQGTGNYDANGHYARIQPIFGAFSFEDNPAGGTLTPIPPAERLTQFEQGNLERCPGAGSQPTADGSAPWRNTDGTEDCDPSQVLPGP